MPAPHGGSVPGSSQSPAPGSGTPWLHDPRKASAVPFGAAVPVALDCCTAVRRRACKAAALRWVVKPARPHIWRSPTTWPMPLPRRTSSEGDSLASRWINPGSRQTRQHILQSLLLREARSQLPWHPNQTISGENNPKKTRPEKTKTGFGKHPSSYQVLG